MQVSKCIHSIQPVHAVLAVAFFARPKRTKLRNPWISCTSRVLTAFSLNHSLLFQHEIKREMRLQARVIVAHRTAAPVYRHHLYPNPNHSRVSLSLSWLSLLFASCGIWPLSFLSSILLCPLFLLLLLLQCQIGESVEGFRTRSIFLVSQDNSTRSFPLVSEVQTPFAPLSVQNWMETYAMMYVCHRIHDHAGTFSNRDWEGCHIGLYGRRLHLVHRSERPIKEGRQEENVREKLYKRNGTEDTERNAKRTSKINVLIFKWNHKKLWYDRVLNVPINLSCHDAKRPDTFRLIGEYHPWRPNDEIRKKAQIWNSVRSEFMLNACIGRKESITNKSEWWSMWLRNWTRKASLCEESMGKISTRGSTTFEIGRTTNRKRVCAMQALLWKRLRQMIPNSE